MKYKLSEYWVLREDRLKKQHQFSLFSVHSKEKKILNKPALDLMKIFERGGVDLGLVRQVIGENLQTNEADLLDDFVAAQILVPDDEKVLRWGKEYDHMTSDVALDKLRKQSSIALLSTPEMAEIHFTSTCNLSCLYCAYSAEPKKSEIISSDQWKIIFDQLESMRVCEITLSGGELFLHPEITALLTDLSNRRFAVTIFTNGMLIREKHISALRAKNIKVAISLDGLDESSHEDFRGKGSLKRVLSGIKLLSEGGVYYYLSTTIHKKNYQTIETLIQFAIDHKAVAIEMGLAADVGRCSGQEIAISSTESISFTAQLKKLQHQYPAINLSFRGLKERTSKTARSNYEGVYCSAGTSRITIDSKGDVYPCVLCFGDSKFKIHNALDGEMHSMWIKGIWPLVRERIDIKKLSNCSKCSKNEFCEEVNCRLSAFYSKQGNILGSTPFCSYS